MKAYTKKYAPRLALLLVAVVAIVLIARSALGGRAGLARNATGGLAVPVEKASSSVAEWLEGIYGYLYRYDMLEAENEDLRAQLAELQQELIAAQEYREENEYLRELLNFAQKNSSYVFEAAKVISGSTSNWSSTLTLSKGSSNCTNPMEVGDCVVTEYGALVGQIIEMGDTWCTVRTIVDSEIDVGALVGEAGAAGMCVGDFSLMQEKCLKLTYLSESAQMVEGDAVLTSGKGSSIPQGLVIGYIRSVLSEAAGQTLYGVVEPACDLDALTHVYVITDYKITE